MFEIRVEADFSAAHFLQDYHGKCENLHGHNYKVFAYARGDELGEGGMLVDFAEVKKHLRAACDFLDHTNLNDIAEFAQNPSAERIARFIFEKLRDKIPSLYAIDVFETPSNRARYIRD
jgi:6-pyruvoyltetrahydropterin/6-carboxytetrahydropterin synthase